MGSRLFDLVLYLMLFSVVRGIFDKTRLCLQCEINNYNSSAVRLKVLNRTSRVGCFIACVRYQLTHSSCRAFQFHRKQGLCELLPEVDLTCMAGDVVQGITFVGLSKCHFSPPLKSAIPENGTLCWVTDPHTKDGTVYERSPAGAVRYVTRVLHQGLYLPGFTHRKRFHSAGLDRVPFTCKFNIQYLTFEDPSQYNWEPFQVGDPIPSMAIIDGYWSEYTPQGQWFSSPQIPQHELKIMTGYFEGACNFYLSEYSHYGTTPSLVLNILIY